MTVASPPPTRRVAPSVLLLVTASALALLGRTGAALLAVSVAVIGQQLAWLHPERARRAAVAVDRAIGRLGHGLGTVLFGAMHVVLIVPAWALGGRRTLHRSTTWQPLPGAGEPSRLYGAAPEDPPGRRWGFDAFVGAALVVAAVAILRIEPPTDVPTGAIADRATSTERLAPALAHQPDAAAVLAEQGQVFAARTGDDELGWVLGDSTGDLVRVRNGERLTPVPDGAGDDPLVVWFFGGSQAWGLGVDDDATIPARFAARATASGRPVTARNFAVPAYLIDQSSKLLERELARQTERPDLIVFVDGYNEMYGGMASTLAGVAPGTPFTAYGPDGAAGTGTAYDGPVASLEERYDGVLAMHGIGRERAEEAARAAGVPIVFAWQPDVYSGRPRPGEAGVLRELGWSDRELADLRTADREIRRRLPDQVIDLGGVFDEVDEPIYWDTVHVNDRGADLIARALLEDVAGRLDSLEGDR